MFKTNPKQKRLLIPHSLYQIFGAFKSAFLNVYLFQVLEGNLIELSIYNLIWIVFCPLCFLVIYCCVPKNKLKSVYPLSFFVTTLEFFILFLVRENLNQYYYLVGVLEGIAVGIYYSSYNLLVYDVTDDKTATKNYFTLEMFLKYLIRLTFIFGFGSLITTGSYQLVFGFLTLLGVVSAYFASRIKTKKSRNEKLQIAEFWQASKKCKKIFYIYAADFAGGLGHNSGALSVLLNLVVFASVGNEMDLGIWTSIFVGVSCLGLLITHHLPHFKKSAYIILASAIILNLSSIPMFLYGGLNLVILYNLVYYAVMPTIIEPIGGIYNYTLVNQYGLRKYYREHTLIREIVLLVARVFSFSTMILFISVGQNQDILKILTSFYTLMIVGQALVYLALEKRLHTTVEAVVN